MNSDKIKLELNNKGFSVVKKFFSYKEKKMFLNFADQFSKIIIDKWAKKANHKKVINKKNLRNKIIKYYYLFEKPKYRRDPQKNCANKEFFKIINLKKFINFHKIVQSKNWYFSFIKNIRFKCSLLPWTSSKWHCDRLTFKDYENTCKDFLVFWIPLQEINKKRGGGLEIVPKNIYSFNDINRNSRYKIDKKNFFLLDKAKHKKKFQKKTVIPKLKFGDVLVFDSRVIHRTNRIMTKNPFWNMDIRYEYGDKINLETKRGGFNMFSSKKIKFEKLSNSANIKIV